MTGFELGHPKPLCSFNILGCLPAVNKLGPALLGLSSSIIEFQTEHGIRSDLESGRIRGTQPDTSIHIVIKCGTRYKMLP